MAANRYIKLALFERCATRLQDCKVVGQGDEYILLERPAVKPRAAAKTAIKRSKKTRPAGADAPVAQGAVA